MTSVVLVGETPKPVQTRRAARGAGGGMGEGHDELLQALHTPMTVCQLGDTLGVHHRVCSRLLRTLSKHGRVVCLTPGMRRSRVYARAQTSSSALDWELYSWVCFSHRRAVLDALDKPRQPAEIKREARRRDPGIRMSANNVRDVIRAFRRRGLVTAVETPGHPKYALTSLGTRLREHLLLAETPNGSKPR